MCREDNVAAKTGRDEYAVESRCMNAAISEGDGYGMVFVVIYIFKKGKEKVVQVTNFIINSSRGQRNCSARDYRSAILMSR